MIFGFSKDKYGMAILKPSDRLAQLEKKLNIKLPQIGKAAFDEEEPVHCENLIGATTIPLGVAGPLLIKGEGMGGEYYIPLATTEGALVASVNRGCKAVTESGGVLVYIEKGGITRGPVFQTGTIDKGVVFTKWLAAQERKLKQVAASTSSHLTLGGFESKVIGSYTYVRLYFETGEAMGMNMATIASNALCQFIQQETGVRCISVSGNYCVDKKPSWSNFINGRGMQGWADVTLSSAVVKEILKTTPNAIVSVWLAKNMIGSSITGSMGFNGHFANMVAALFAATGQDLAHVVEGSLGITTAHTTGDGGLYFSVHMPSIIAGIVGGGMKLAIKKEALSILRVNSSSGFAACTVAAVLAGELSLLAALAEGSLAASHRRLGR
jgi:hydroxymethylglutaryl-CoA reductase (NADPH)